MCPSDVVAGLVLLGVPLVFGPTGIPVTLLSPSRDGKGFIGETRDGDIVGGAWGEVRMGRSTPYSARIVNRLLGVA